MARPKPLKKATLNLGVVDQFYGGVFAPGSKVPPPVSTGDVAQWLEDRYDIMGQFWKRNQHEIIRYVEESIRKEARNVLAGKPQSSSNDPYAAGMAMIEKRFRAFLSLQEMDTTGVPGVPTKAALMGISSRFKSGKNWVKKNRKKKRGVPRPSFIDTGLYQTSFRSWITFKR